jgi:hypothetical protein
MEFTQDILNQKASSIKPFEFTQETLRKTLDKHGLEKVARDLAKTYERGNEDFFTYETLLDGTAPILNLKFETGDKQRPRSPQDILTMFSNVRDFEGNQLKALGTGVAEKALPATGMAAGAYKGTQAGARLAALIPPLGPAGIIAKGATILGGGLLGGIFGDTLFRKVDDQVFGEDAPVAPSLKAAYNAGETLAYGGSMLWAPYRLPSKEGFFGATRFLDNFQRARNPSFVGPIQLSPKMLKRARSVKQPDTKSTEIFETLFTGPKARFKPDPTKGPVNARILASLEKGVVKAGESARANPIITAMIEGLAVSGAAGGAYGSQKLFPDNETARLGFEIAGSFSPGVLIKTGFELGKLSGKTVKNVVGATSKLINLGVSPGNRQQAQQMATDKYKIIAGRRLYEAFANAPVQEDGTYTINDVLDVYNPEKTTTEGKIEKLPLMVGDKEFVPSGEGVAAVEYAKELEAPFAKRMQDIADVVTRTSDELAVATKSGREAYIVKAKNLILDFQTVGDPDSIAIAAEMQSQLDKIGIELQIKETQERLLNAANRVLGEDGQYGSEQLNLSQKIETNLRQTYEASNRKIKDLYDQIGETEITSFSKMETDAEGNNIRVDLEEPSFLTIFETEQPRGVKSTSEGSHDIFVSQMGSLMKDIQKARQLFRGEGDVVNRSLENFTNFYNQMRGTSGRRVFDNTTGGRNFEQIIVDFDNPTEEALELLRREESRSRSLSGQSAKDQAKLFKLAGDRMAADLTPPTEGVTGAPDAAPEPFTLQGLMDYRGDLLDKARELETIKPKLSKKFSRLARAVLDDITNADNVDSALYNRARSYVKAHKDVFSRTFAGELFKTDPSGAPKIDEGQLLNKMFGGGSSPAYIRLKQIQGANIFGLKQELPDGENRVFTMHESLEKAVRDSLRNITDPETGKISSASLNTFKRKPATQETFSLFPALAEDLKSLEKAQALADSVDESVKIFQNSDGYKRINRLLGENSENPASEIALAIRSKAPTSALNEIYDLVVKDPTASGVRLDMQTKTGVDAAQLQQENKDALKSAIFNYAVISSGGEGASFSPDAFNRVFFDKMKNSNISLADWMKSSGKQLINDSEKKLLQQALKEMKEVEEAFRTGELEDVLFKNPTGIKMFATRIIGATSGKIGQQRLESVIERLTGGRIKPSGGLIAESEGSKQAQAFILKTPEILTNKAMTELLQDAEMLGVILRRVDNEKQMKGVMTKIKEFLSAKGIRFGLTRVPYIMRSEAEDIERAEPFRRPMQFAPRSDPEPVSDASPAMNAVRPALPPVAQATPPPAQADPQTRQKYAALFPNDPTSAMIKGNQGGIGSLFG